MISFDRPTNRRCVSNAAWAKWLACFALALGFTLSAAVSARAETRTLKLYFIHTKERAEITFKRNGRYDQNGLKQINRFLRDWRRNEPTKMDPRLLDLVWETYRASGARDYIHVVSAYRSPATNSMLRSRSKGVAEKSQHMLGRAMDFYIPGVPLKKLRDSGLRMQVGGVGYYPRSGSPFVHLDVGNVRHWPRMSRKELVAVFPSGKTLHVPSDGKPLPGYETALASYQARKKSGTTALAMAGSGRSGGGRGLLAALFGGGADEDEDSGEAAAAAAPAARAKAAAPVAAPPAAIAAPAEEPRDETPETIIAALPARSVPLPAFAPRPKAEVGAVETVAGIPVAADRPFGMAEALAEGAVAEDGSNKLLVANVPLPSWRPDPAPVTAAVAGEEAGADEPDEDEVASVLLAMAEGPVNAPRSITIGGPLPVGRPEPKGGADNGGYSMAGLPGTATATVLEAEVRESKARLAALSTGATRPAAVVSSGKDARAIGVGARTTAKTARARSKDAGPDPKPMIMAAQPEAVRWALAADYMAPAEAQSDAAPVVARDLVRKAPSQVYATGFRQASVADAGRFSGKAVSFLPIARFETN